MSFRKSSGVSRRQALAMIGSTLALGSLSGRASAAAFPTRPVTIVIPFAAGGTTDVAARKLGDLLRKRWNQAVVVLNRPGAGTLIASESVARSAPDGHTILIAPDPTYSINPLVYPKLPYDPVKDFAPVTTLLTYPLGIAVSSSLGVKTLKELVEISKTKDLNYGSFGIGTAPHLVMELFKAQSGLKMEHIPYNGVAPVLLALSAGDIHATVMGAGAGAPHINSGKIRLLAMDEKTWLYPDVPTFAEAGYPNMRAPAWWGVAVAAGTPAAIVQQIHQDIVATLKDPEMVAYLRNAGYDPAGDRPEDLARRMRDTRAVWTPVIQAKKIQVNN